MRPNHLGCKSYHPYYLQKENFKLLISLTNTITNTISNQTCFKGVNANTIGKIYSALCAKHVKLYVGQIRQSLNKRFNSHHLETVHYPDWFDLVQHYNKHDCDIRHDLEISVLEHARGSSDYMKQKEDKWIIRLQTYSPLWLNSRRSDFGCVYHLLFSKTFLSKQLSLQWSGNKLLKVFALVE